MMQLLISLALAIGMFMLSDWLTKAGFKKLGWWVMSLSAGAGTVFLVGCFFPAITNLSGEAFVIVVLGASLGMNFVRNLLSDDAGVKGAAADVRIDAERTKKMLKPFDPEKYIDIQKGIFLGLDMQRKPVYVSKTLLDENHIEILGESGVGKSSLAGVMLSQLAAAGETVILFDPKNDARMPGVLARAGKKHGFPVRIINLQLQFNKPMLNPFKNCREDQVEELLQAALELGKTGDSKVDFHRGNDRQGTWHISSAVAESLADGATSLLEIVDAASKDERITQQENLWRELRQLGRLRAFHTTGGLDLEKVLSEPGVLYIIGHTKSEEVKAGQRLLLQRCLQIIDERKERERPVCIFMDELKHVLSTPALTAAGTIRDRNCHLIFAHQSLGDLEDCPGLNPKAVRGAVWGNSSIRFVYRTQDGATARELETVAGTIAVAATSHSSSDERESQSIRVEKGLYMPAHVFTHLPKPTSGEASVGVVFGLGPAWFLSTRYRESGPAPLPEPAPLEVRTNDHADEFAGVAPAREADDLSDIMK